jgi:hypothetical protein
VRPVAALVLGLGVAACGVYGVRVEPPPPRAPVARPLDLSVSLGDVRSYVDGLPVGLEAAALAEIDGDFVRAAEASGLFRRVEPRGTPTDLRVDTVRSLHDPPPTVGRAAYLILVAPLAFGLPGFPHPWDYHVTRTVRLRGDVDGTAIPLPEREIAYDERVWGANWWGGRAVDPLRWDEGAWIAGTVAGVVNDARAVFDRFEAAARAGDVEEAWLASVESGAAH